MEFLIVNGLIDKVKIFQRGSKSHKKKSHIYQFKKKKTWNVEIKFILMLLSTFSDYRADYSRISLIGVGTAIVREKMGQQ